MQNGERLGKYDKRERMVLEKKVGEKCTRKSSRFAYLPASVTVNLHGSVCVPIVLAAQHERVP